MTRPFHLLLVLTCLMLSACGGGGDTLDPSKVLQESQLYHPVSNPAGAVEQLGQTAVLGLEADDSDLPPSSDAAQKGVENLWFEVKDSQSVQFALDADTLAAIDRVEIRDQGNTLLATVRAASPGISLSLAPGRYQAQMYAHAASTTPVPVFAQYAAVQDVGKAQSQAATASDRVRPQYDFFSAVGMFFGVSCKGCDLKGVALPGWNFSGRDFSGADLDGANLSGVNLTGALLYGANLSGVNFTKADLSGADLLGAYFKGADLTGAKLTGAWFSSANFSFATWVDGRRCGKQSIGTCK